MSGDVQPRKRKDKKRKKDDLSVEEPRGTAAVFGEGDVFMHSQHDHGTGGHWCAKVIFFSLLAVLVTLIGLIILENRGLTELEANSVESKYSGVLEGWIEVHDDHHDEHTLELKHHSIDQKGDQNVDNSHEAVEAHGVDEDENQENDVDDGPEDESDQDNEDEDHDDEDIYHDDEGEHDSAEDVDHDDVDERDNSDEDELDDDDLDHDDGNEYDDENNQLQESEEQIIKKVKYEAEDYQRNYKKYYVSDDDDKHDDHSEDDDDDDDIQKGDDNDERDTVRSSEADDDDNENNYQSLENNSNDNENSAEADEYNDDLNSEDNDDENEYDEMPDNEEEEDHGGEEESLDVEVEKIEQEASDEPDDELTPTELPFASGNNDSNDDSEEKSNEKIVDEDVDIEEEEFLELEDVEVPPVVERITAPAGKPLPEVEEDTSSEKPQDTLAQEEEYEKQQEQLRREKEQASHMWLKVVVGGALLAATHAVVRRATAPRDEPVSGRRASTPLVDRRMTLIPDQISPVIPTVAQERYQPIIQREIVENVPVVTKPVQVPDQDSEEEEEEENDEIPFTPQDNKTIETEKDDVDKELYSDEDDEDEIIEEKKETPKTAPPIEKERTPEIDEDSDDVEIIDDEQLDEELLEEEEEEEISDVDDVELLRRLEAKYGRLPEPERPGQKHKDGGNSIEDEWPGEPDEEYWREQLHQAERELRQGEWRGAAARAGAPELRASGRARYVKARALDAAAEARRDNTLLSQAVAAYLDVLKMNDRLSDKRLIEIARRTLDRIQFRGNYMGAEPVYRLLIRRFPDDPDYRNNLTVSFLMANRADLAEEVLKETLLLWPDDRFALAHLGFVLKTLHNRLEEAVDAFQKALEGDTGPATEPRFYYHLGDALLLLGRHAEAQEVHRRGSALGHFLSPSQRSLYNVNRLKSQPWWRIEDTPYTELARALERSWRDILKEGEAAKALYEKEKEGLRERGEWSQLDLFVRGREIPGQCQRAPVTCSIIRQETAAAGCRRGQVKFSSMEAGTHVRPHVGPTNCRLRMHLGLSNTKDTFIRVDQETRQWQIGKVLLFDDSFEHEVWHNGTGTRLVLIVDVWHPDLTPTERRQLPAI